MNSRWQTQRGKRVFFVDLANQDLQQNTKEGVGDIATPTREPERSVLSLVDVTGLLA
jgi:hypothetical protein